MGIPKIITYGFLAASLLFPAKSLAQSVEKSKGPPTLPISIENMRSYDLNKDGRLSPLEIELVRAGAAAFLFETAVRSKEVDFDGAYQVLSQLSTSKLARILHGITQPEFRMHGKNLKRELFTRLAEHNLDRAVDVVMNLKEDPYGFSILGEGEDAGYFLDIVTPDLRNKILTKVKEKDPKYHRNLASYGARLQAWGSATGKFKVVSSATKPKPFINDNRKHSVDDPKAVEVFQREYAITSATTKKPVLQTFGASTCVIVTLYDSKSKLGVITHIDGITEVHESFDQIFAELKALGVNDSSRLEARVIGGAKRGSEKTVYAINDRLAEARVRVVEKDFLHYSAVTRASLQLDTRTGRVTNYTEAGPVRGDLSAHNEKLFKRPFAKKLHRHADSLETFLK